MPDPENLTALSINNDLVIAALLGQDEELVMPVATLGLAEVNLQDLTRNCFGNDTKDNLQRQNPLGERLRKGATPPSFASIVYGSATG